MRLSPTGNLMEMSRPKRLIVLASVFVMMLTACSSEDRPSNAEWVPKWDAMVAVVPDQSEVGSPPDEEVCQSTLSALRVENEGLLPTPTATIDDLVADWTAIAEAAFFECPPESGSFTESYHEMATIQDSIDTALSG